MPQTCMRERAPRNRSSTLSAFLLHLFFFFGHWAQAQSWIRPPGAEHSLKLTTRHYGLRTKGRANPTCSLFTATVGLLLCAFWPLRGGPLTRELNYHGNSHRQAHVSLSLSLPAQWDILTQSKTFHRKHTTPNVPLLHLCVSTQIQPLFFLVFFFLFLFHVLHPSFSLPPQKEVPLNGGIEEKF